jgi:hypothetical protein
MDSLLLQHDTCQFGHGGDVFQMWSIVMNMLNNHCKQLTGDGPLLVTRMLQNDTICLVLG